MTIKVCAIKKLYLKKEVENYVHVLLLRYAALYNNNVIIVLYIWTLGILTKSNRQLFFVPKFKANKNFIFTVFIMPIHILYV